MKNSILIKQKHMQRKNRSKENILKGGGEYLTINYPPVEKNYSEFFIV